jgi:hypothetical protein
MLGRLFVEFENPGRRPSIAALARPCPGLRCFALSGQMRVAYGETVETLFFFDPTEPSSKTLEEPIC